MIASVVGVATMYLIHYTFPTLEGWIRRVGGPLAEAAAIIAMFFAPFVAAVVVYGRLTRRYYRWLGVDTETRCRKCRHILRGISEPRCPECGERI